MILKNSKTREGLYQITLTNLTLSNQLQPNLTTKTTLRKEQNWWARSVGGKSL
jgi:hypothetical protein